jgi:regulator of protease activity HflC (stomatin/prohibitin superfamily)
MGPVIITVVIILFVIIMLSASLRVVKEYERGVVFRLGRFVGVRGPGLIGLIPFIERMTKVGLRTITMDVPPQEAITRDNITVKVDAVVYFRVVEASEAILKVQDYIQATSMLCQTTLRNVVGQSEMDELLAHRDKINEKLQKIIDEGTAPWGIKVSLVETKDVQMPATMQRAMAAQAEAERERRAKVVHADGEFQAAQKLADAAHVISTEPAALQLRYLQTLITIATEKTNTIVFPLPVDLIAGLINKSAEKKQA